MNVEIIRSNNLIAGPMPFESARVRDIVMRQGGDYRLIPNGFYKALHIGTISVLPVRHDKPELTVLQAYGQPERTASNDEVVYTYPVVERDPAEVLEEQKLAAAKRVNSGYQAELNAILSDYPDAETKTWDKQEAEARAYQADSAAPTPLIDAIATARDMDKAELVQRVIAKADAWIALSGAATGKRQALEDAIAEAETLQVVEGIRW